MIEIKDETPSKEEKEELKAKKKNGRRSMQSRGRNERS